MANNETNGRRPSLVIEHLGGRNLGRCYNAMFYRVTSTQALSRDDLSRLRDIGFLGYGQEFICEGPVRYEDAVPTGIDEDGTPYFVYSCESRVDSSD